MTRPIEMWGVHSGGRSGSVPHELTEAIRELIRKYGREPVAQVAVLESGIEPRSDRRD